MQDRDLYRVELKLAEGEVHVYLEHKEQKDWPCAECGVGCRLYDHQAERKWRHLDTCQYQTILYAPATTDGVPGAWSASAAAALGGALQPIHSAI